MKNTFKILIASVMLAFGSVASGAVLSPLTIDFAYAGFDDSTFDGTSVPAEFSGSMAVDKMVIGGGGYTGQGEYNIINGVITINTAAAISEIIITGGISDYNLADSTVLFSGAFEDWDLSTDGPFDIFQGGGSGLAGSDILNAIGDQNAGTLAFYGFTMKREISPNATITSTDFLTTEVTSRNINPVPIPAAAWLFGSGLIGLVGVARRKDTV